jgi:hypothetical protein
MLTCKKPIFPVLPCLNIAGREVKEFIDKGHVNFADEVALAEALIRVADTPKPATTDNLCPEVDVKAVRAIIDGIKDIRDSKGLNDLKDSTYNLAGQKVGKDYKGIVIQGGKKYLRK